MITSYEFATDSSSVRKREGWTVNSKPGVQWANPVHCWPFAVHALPDQRQRVFQHPLEGLKELRTGGPVDHPMVARHGDAHPPAERYLLLFGHRLPYDP